MWFEILKRQVEGKGVEQVAAELCVGVSTVDLVMRETYPASTDNFARKVLRVYGNNNGSIHCTILGSITPEKCAEKYILAKKIGYGCGSPETLRLYHQCLKCPVRQGSK